MAHPWLLIVVALVADGLAGLAGGLLSDRWLQRRQPVTVGFAAGALLAAVFLDILPESIAQRGPVALAWAFAALVVLAFVEWLVGFPHGHAPLEERRSRALPASLLASDALHNVGDGAAVAAAFLVSPEVGLGTAVAVIAHEVPQEVGDFAVLRAWGLGRGKALAALAAVQLTAALGALGVGLAAGHVHELTGIVLSIAAGTFLYIGATDLLPEVHRGRSTGERSQRMIGFLCGAALVVATTVVDLG
ncbi:MAG: ZIP family metal transporter [Deltaproteobacteria bacterium]|nr:ZIP family metal transporter [Deltaproteobacteria bacterium]